MKRQGDILQALDAFIRKYYKNLLIKGILYAVGIMLNSSFACSNILLASLKSPLCR